MRLILIFTAAVFAFIASSNLAADVGYRIAPTLAPFGGSSVSGIVTVTNNAANDNILSNAELTSWNWQASLFGDSLSGSSAEAGASSNLQNIRITDDFITLTPWTVFPNNTRTFSTFALSTLAPGATDAKRFSYYNANNFGNPLTQALVGNYDLNNNPIQLWNTAPAVTALGGEPWTIATRLGSVGGNDTFFTVNAGNVLGGGNVETNDLGALHRGYVDSFGGIGLQTEMSELTREFVFTRGDGGSGPVDVYVHGFVEGLMEADKFGRASLESSLQLLDLNGNVLGEAGFDKSVETNGLQVVNVDLFEPYGFDVQLTPGTTYVIKSLLSAEADGAAQGRGLVDLRNTFEYVLSAVGENPYEDPSRATMETVSTVPLPGALVFLISGLIGLMRFRART